MNCKRFVAICLIVALCVLMLPAQALATDIASGSCGKNLTWVLDSEGTLTVSGTGKMSDYILGAPWAGERDRIIRVVLEEGVTYIGVSAFQGYENLETITLPDTLTEIGDWAFFACRKLSGVAMPKSVTKIGTEAFANCSGLRGVYITDLAAWMRIAFEGGEYLSNPECANPLYWGAENKLYLNGELLTEVTIPDGITEIGPAVLSSPAITKVVIPEGVTTIGNFAFSSCVNLSDISLPDSVTSIGKAAFQDCDAITSMDLPKNLQTIGDSAFYLCDGLTSISIPGSVTSIGRSAFCQCDNLVDVTIAEGVTCISNSMFAYCDKLANVTIPSSITTVEKMAFAMCYALKNVYFNGKASQWESLLPNVGENNNEFLKARIHISGNPLVVYSDAAGLDIEIGEAITLSAGIWVENETLGDPSGITFQLADGHVVKLLGTEVKDNQVFLRLEGVMNGTTYVTFSDSANGKSVTVPVTVTEEKYVAYTLETVPEFTVVTGPIVEGPVNFYNCNGLYIDSFEATVSDSGKAMVSFDVYNTNHSYAIVEIYDENGELYNAVLIDKMNYLNDSIKNVLWDGTACVVRDWYSGNLLTYKQETNVSKLTHVEIEIPKNGYIEITASSMESGLLAIVNGADLWLSSLAAVKKFDGLTAGYAVSDELMDQLLEDDYYLQMAKADEDFAKEVLKGFHENTVISAKSLGDFSSSLYTRLVELNRLEIVLKSAVSTGQGIVEDELKNAMGVFGEALDAVFFIGEVEDLVCQYYSFDRTARGSVITIQNQGGGIRHCDNIVLESTVDFDPETALQVYSVTLDEALLEKVKQADRTTYDLLVNGLVKTYNISLVKQGEKIQHGGDVAVYIPIPEELELLGLNGHIKVFRIEEDGSVTDMDAVVEGDCVLFTTDHFSLYTLVGFEKEDTPSEPTVPGTEPTQPQVEQTKPTDKPIDKEDPMDEPQKQDSHDGGIVIIMIVAAVLLIGVGTAIILLQKKK